MASPLIYPKFQGIAPTTIGAAAAGFKLKTFAAGSSTPLATYTDSTLVTANATTVVMDANGEANVWLGQLSYKFIFTDPADVVIWTVDNVTQASLGSLQSEWVSFGATPTFISATSFSLVGITDLTIAPFFIAIGTRIRTVNTGGTVYSTVTAVSANTITVVNDSGVLDAGLSAASYGIIAGSNPSSFRRSLVATLGGTNVVMVSGVATKLTGTTKVVDLLNEFASDAFTPKVNGTYRIWGAVLMNEGAATTGIQNVAQSVVIRKGGIANITETINWIPAASIQSTQAIPFGGTLALLTSDTVDFTVTMTFTGTAPTAAFQSLNIERVL